MNKMQKGKGGQNFDKEGVNLKFRPASQEYSEVSSTWIKYRFYMKVADYLIYLMNQIIFQLE